MYTLYRHTYTHTHSWHNCGICIPRFCCGNTICNFHCIQFVAQDKVYFSLELTSSIFFVVTSIIYIDICKLPYYYIMKILLILDMQQEKCADTAHNIYTTQSWVGLEFEFLLFALAPPPPPSSLRVLIFSLLPDPNDNMQIDIEMNADITPLHYMHICFFISEFSLLLVVFSSTSSFIPKREYVYIFSSGAQPPVKLSLYVHVSVSNFSMSCCHCFTSQVTNNNNNNDSSIWLYNIFSL